MSSESRSSSAVRNLRSIFENKASENSSSDSRGRSPNGVGSDKENSYQQPPKNKVKANFVAVEPVPSMAARRGSFGEADGDLELKKTISEQQEELGVPEAAVESMPPSVVATPLRPPNEGRLGHDPLVPEVQADAPPENPDKPVTGAEEDPVEMKPADPASEEAVSGGAALPPVAEDLRSPPTASTSVAKAVKKFDSKKTPTTSKPPAISTTASAKAAPSSIKSPPAQPKTPLSVKATSVAHSPIAKRPSRSSLTAPTAASIARSGQATDKAKTSPTSSNKPREVTKPLNISSHLTAPTASSKAKHDPEAPAPTSSMYRTSLSSRPKPPIASTKPTARSSLAAGHRSESQSSQSDTRRSLAAVDGSFLDRMTRPTAASSGRTTEKVAAAKSPPKSKPVAPKPKTNGHVSKPTPKVETPAMPADEPIEAIPELDVAESAAHPALTFAANTDNAVDAAAAVEDGGLSGHETPSHLTIEQGDVLEATPAGLGGEDTIR